MAENSKIEWTKHTCNLWHGCTKVHAGCDNCYAETLSHRWGRDIWGNDKPRMEIKSVWNDFKKYQEAAAAVGEIHNVFVGSMMDIFEKPMPMSDSKGNSGLALTGAARDKYFNEIVPATPNLMHLMLTKRPSNILKYIPKEWLNNMPSNVMFGTSPCDQPTADNLIPHLLEAPGRKFLSVEPLLGSVDLCQSVRIYQFAETRSFHSTFFADKIHWVIVGGESGHGKRPMDLAWPRAIRDQCKMAGVPFFMKQIDKVQEIPEDLMIRQFPKIAV